MKKSYLMLVLGMTAMVFGANPAKRKAPTPKPPEPTTQAESFKPEEWKMTKDGGFLAYTVNFNISNNERDLGYVQRKGLCTPRYSYTLFDEDGEKVAYGMTRFLSLGFFFHDITQIDMYDANQKYIGGAYGKIFSSSRARFDFYEGKQYTGSALVNSETTDFILTANKGKKGNRKVGTIKGEAYGDVSELTVTIDQKGFDDRLLKIFAGFVSDYHDYFVVKPQTNVYIDASSDS